MEKEKLKIVFYNNAHIGDIFFSQPYVRNIIDSNCDKFDYYIYCECNYFIFTSLFSNIKKIKEYPEVYNIIQSYGFHPGEKLYHYDKDNNILLLGTWYANFKRLPGVSSPMNCDLFAYNDFYNLVIQRLNAEYNICVNYSTNTIFPKFPNINIQKFLDYKKIQDDKNIQIVFYYNVLAYSSQRFPVNNHQEHLHIIIELLKKENIVLFLPYKIENIVNYINENKITNIIFVDDMFDLSSTDEDCSNIYYYSKIALHCEVSYYFDTGRCFLYVNNEFIENNIFGCKRYHISNDSYYYHMFNKYFDNSYSNFVACNNYIDIIHFIQNNI